MKLLRAVLLVAFATTIGAVGFLYSGLYPMGADTPHTGPVYWALETLRERSIARAIRDIEAPDLSDPQLLLAGGPDYNDMCAGCHLKPGRSASDLSQGLYPQPPNLAEASDDHSHAHDPAISAARQFWIIKHGINLVLVGKVRHSLEALQIGFPKTIIGEKPMQIGPGNPAI